MEKITKILKNRHWSLLGRWKHPLVLGDLVTGSITDKNLKTTFPAYPEIYIIINFKQFVSKKDYKKNIHSTELLLNQNVNHVIREIKKEVTMSLNKLLSFKPTKFDYKEVKEYFKQARLHGRQWYQIMLIDNVLEKFYLKSLPENFKLTGKKYTPHSLLAKTALPKKLFPMIKEQYDLLKIAIEAKAGKNIESKLKQHAKKYSWMNSMNWWLPPFTTEHYRKEVEEIIKGNPSKQFKELQVNRKQQYKEAANLLKELKKNYPDAWRLIDIIRDMADLKEENWDVISTTGTRMRPKFGELASKFFLTYNQFMMMTRKEMLKTLKENNLSNSPKELNQRLKNYAIISRGSISTVISGNKSLDLLELVEKEVKKVSSLKGMSVWLGEATGKVRVLYSVDDIHKMQTGEILVCPMTDPDFMPAIKKARAIVTDQGGILCHAAIVARELQTPCIVGTEIATKVLKDGDLVEVDTDNGIIRKLK